MRWFQYQTWHHLIKRLQRHINKMVIQLFRSPSYRFLLYRIWICTFNNYCSVSFHNNFLDVIVCWTKLSFNHINLRHTKSIFCKWMHKLWRNCLNDDSILMIIYQFHFSCSCQLWRFMWCKRVYAWQAPFSQLFLEIYKDNSIYKAPNHCVRRNP